MDDFSALYEGFVYVDSTKKVFKEFPPCAKGNREGGKNGYTFYYIYIVKFFAGRARRQDSPVDRATSSDQ